MEERKQIQELTNEELERVTGGEAAVCLYDDKSYSQGATVSMGGTTKTCSADGTWK